MTVYELHNMMVDHTVDALKIALIDEIDAEDPTRATVVRAGKLQQNPTAGTGVNVLVWPSDDSDPDELFIGKDTHGLHGPTYEIGGTAYFMMRFRIETLFHFRGLQGDEGRDEARERAQVIHGRIRKTLLQMNLRNLPVHPVTLRATDDFGQTPVAVEIKKYHQTEGGGKGHFIWTGSMTFGLLAIHSIEEY